MRKTVITFIALAAVLIAAGFAYVYFLQKAPSDTPPETTSYSSSPSTHYPVNETSPQTQTSSTSNVRTVSAYAPIAKLRLLSATPVGGYGASSTATTTVRWVDRGRGNV